MKSNNHIENINIINANIKTEIFSIINDNSFINKNQSQSKSSEYILTNKQDDKEKIEKQKLILSSSSEKNIYESPNIDHSKSHSKSKNKSKKEVYNILVAVRCRPLSKKEKEISTKETIKIIDEKTLKLKDPNGFLNPNNVRAQEKIMNFDYVFSPFIGQEEIFNNTTKFLIDKIINGFNATVFAYGVTGAGKTYTMLGNDENPGIMVWTFRELYKKINEYKNREYLIKIRYVEIYNENIRDLLNNKNEKNENLELREDPEEGIIINNITEIITNSINEILHLLKKGNKNRTVEETDANKTSSRSHAILQIKVSFKEKNSENNHNEVKFGKLNLIDLAGSERAGTTKNRGLRLIEGANINKSLLTLGNCINALADKNQNGRKIYIPYRDSKLTRLLKDSLGGNSRTVMIANISPFIYNFDDTYNTLKYAERAKCIKTRVKINIANNNKSNDFIQLIKSINNRLHKLGNQINFGNKNIKIKINNDNINKRNQSANYSQYSLNKRKRNTYNFNENTFSDDDLNIKTKSEKSNFNDNKKKSLTIDTKKNKYKEKKINKDFNAESITEKNKKISLIIDDYIQQTEAEIQLKQKIINIQYNLILLYNKFQKNSPLKKNNSDIKIKLKNMKQMLEKNIETLNELTERNENFIKKYIENNDNKNNDEDIEFNVLQKKYIYIVYKNTKILKENIEIKFKYTIMKNEFEKKDNYIKEIEKQIMLRDFIIKELLYFDNISKQDIDKESNGIKNDMKDVLSNILKKEKNIHYQSLSQLKNQHKIFNFKNRRNIDNKINISRPNTNFTNNKSDSYLYQNTNSTNKECFNEKESFIIDFDREKPHINNTYINLKIPTLNKSNSSFNINKFDRKISKKFLNSSYNCKIEIESEKNISSFPYDKYINENNSNNMNYKVIDLDNNKEEKKDKIKSILTKIKNMNNEISSQMSIIEQQSNRNRKVMGITGQIINKIYDKSNTEAFINIKKKEDKLLQLNQNNLKINLTRDKHSLKKVLLENLNKENNDTNYKINIQKRKNQERNERKKLLKSEGNTNKNPRIIKRDKIESNLLFKKLNLTREKSENKNNSRIKKIRNSKSKIDLSQVKSFINAFNQDKTNNKKKFEKNKSALNISNIKKAKIYSDKKENYYNKNNNHKKLNVKMIKDNGNRKKYNTIFISTNFNDNNPVYVQNKTSFLNKRYKDKNQKLKNI